MKSILLALLMLPGLAMAFSPDDITKIKGVQPVGTFPCMVGEDELTQKAQTCWELTYAGIPFRLITAKPDTRDEVIEVYTIPSEIFESGKVPLDFFQSILDRETSI